MYIQEKGAIHGIGLYNYAFKLELRFLHSAHTHHSHEHLDPEGSGFKGTAYLNSKQLGNSVDGSYYGVIVPVGPTAQQHESLYLHTCPITPCCTLSPHPHTITPLPTPSHHPHTITALPVTVTSPSHRSPHPVTLPSHYHPLTLSLNSSSV